ncbi:Glutamate racemase [Serratia symbiotica]|nr:Glutamate racemase [Serratia symbiotica]
MFNYLLSKNITSNHYTNSHTTILIFDSGFGGLSIYQKVRKLLPNIHYIYVFDNIAFPYGEKSEKFIIERVLNITHAIQKKHSITIMILACNTASVISLTTLRKYFKFPIIGVIPAIKPASYITKNNIIGLLATKATIRCNYTHQLINKFANHCQVKLLASTELVMLSEKKMYGKNISLKKIKKILYPWINMTIPPDTVILGCTHFPLLLKELKIILPKHTTIIDSSTAIAHRSNQLMQLQKKIILTKNNNLVYCMKIYKNYNVISSIFKKYGFTILKKLFF